MENKKISFDDCYRQILKLYKDPWNLSDYDPDKPTIEQATKAIWFLLKLESLKIKAPNDILVNNDGTYTFNWIHMGDEGFKYFSIDIEMDDRLIYSYIEYDIICTNEMCYSNLNKEILMAANNILE